MTSVASTDLGALVRRIDEDCGGNLAHPSLAQFQQLKLQLRTVVDETLSPFSQAYFDQQIAVYEEISGRRLDQAKGELHPLEFERLRESPNPLGLLDPFHAAENVRALTTMLAACALPPQANVLDMGAGHGTSSEVFAFCGCRVHAVDIDPELARLSLARAAERHLPITRSILNFDDLGALPDAAFDAAFFFQSLHHALRPWELLPMVAAKLVEGGVIAFAGEPVQQIWWKHWGIRLDLESVYVARKFGWFESGWSREFISACFTRAGMPLHLLTGGQGGGWIGIACKGPAERVLQRAAQIGCQEVVIAEAPAPQSAPAPAVTEMPPARRPLWRRALGRMRRALLRG